MVMKCKALVFFYKIGCYISKMCVVGTANKNLFFF